MKGNMVNIFGSGGASVTIDGKTFSGNNIQITDGIVIVDGDIQEGTLTGNIKVIVNGDVDTIETGSGDIQATNIGSVETGSGDVECGSVTGNVRTGSGDVECGSVTGNVRTGSGDINHRSI